MLLVDLYVTDVKLADRAEFKDPLPEGGELNLLAIQSFTAAARGERVPIFYTTNLYREDGRDIGGWRYKSWTAESRLAARRAAVPVPCRGRADARGLDHLQAAAQRFFGTQLVSNLTDLGVDTLLVSGQTTSGCVRVTVIDALSYGYRTIVVEECTYDGGTTSHKVNLFDMLQKYADVTPLAEVLTYLGSIGRSSSSRSPSLAATPKRAQTARSMGRAVPAWWARGSRSTQRPTASLAGCPCQAI